MAERITPADVAELMANPSVETQQRIAAQVASMFAAEGFSEAERRVAKDVLRAMVNRTAETVRQALSQHLRLTPILPRDVALALARDVDSVAMPILESSPALNDEDLIEILRGASEDRQVAIAKRPTVSETVSEALVDGGSQRVVTTLVNNEGARLDEQTLHKVVRAFPDDPSVQEGLVKRASLPVSVIERLITRISDTMREYLVVNHALPPELAGELIEQVRERATISMSGDCLAVDEMVRQLHAKGRLTPSIVLRAACSGDTAFFEAAMAAMTGLPMANAQILLNDAGTKGLRAIFQKAKLPEGLYPILETAVGVARETGYDGEPGDRERYQRRMLERVLTDLEDIESDNIEHLLSRLGRHYGGPGASAQSSLPR
ncbi:MAG: DUF2336 domain-containing protein [Alphaproteobacteria bacterium]|nr:DUF2336 domain-containing protein [Alphaproteobacteria bacterium]